MDTTVDHNPNKGLEAHSKSLSNIKRGLQIAGLHGDREGARLALSVLSRLATRLEALRSPAPNLRSTIDALASVCILKVRDADHAKLQERRQKVSFSGAANFSEWLIEQLAHESPPIHNPIWLDVMAVRWLYSAAVRSFGDQLGAPQKVNSPDRNFSQLTTKSGRIDSSTLDIGYEKWLHLVSEQAPFCEIPALVESLRRITEVPFRTPPPRTPRPPPRLNERQLLTTHWLHIRPEQHRQLLELLTSVLTPTEN